MKELERINEKIREDEQRKLDEEEAKRKKKAEYKRNKRRKAKNIKTEHEQIEQQNKNKRKANIQICHLNKYESDQVYEEAKAMERKEKSKKIKTRA